LGVFADKDDDLISAEGIISFCNDLGVEPADVVMVSILSASHTMVHVAWVRNGLTQERRCHVMPCLVFGMRPLHYDECSGAAATSFDTGGVLNADHGMCVLCPPVQLVIAYHMEAAHMGEFTAKEFKDGLMKLGVDSIDKLRKKLPELRGELSSDVTFRPIYNYAYGFSREVGGGHTA
jgi:DCN1-like protein 1/2